MKKTLGIFALILAAMLALTACGTKEEDTTPKKTTPTPAPTMSEEVKALTKNVVNATIELENGDEIHMELYPDLAPETVENFITLANDGFYDGTIFHRVIDGFMIQGGGYDEDLNEQKADTIEGEFSSNGFENGLSHLRGVVSMARAQDPDSASSQFFIVQEDATYLDGEYAAFGMVTDEDSLDVVDDIASVKTGTAASAGLSDVPVSPVVIKSITIESSYGSGSSSSSSRKDDEDSDKDDDKDKDKDNDKDDDDNVAVTVKPGRSSSGSSDSDTDSDTSSSTDSAAGDTNSDADNSTDESAPAAGGIAGLNVGNS